ncbi:sn-1-specific diacylglycerol lipase ABHD11-like isoform X1 [Macrobrachium nipponense]|uniref:sn-1-specific diacylglycerol lipase ABHD11-like isoform X1 n=2 Tax=Macrobrachium nipponense TaxID=159736 RepID=UPI0030C8475C
MTALGRAIRCTSRYLINRKYHGNIILQHQKCNIHNPIVRYAPVSMAYASYQMTNPRKMSQEPPVIIMHGLLGSKMNWKSLGKAINAKTGRLVYSVDARNHGDSPHTPDMSYSLMAEDLLYFLQERGIEKAVLMGHSMGGRTVMAAALMEPSIVEKLIVLDISPLSTSSSISSLPLFVEIMRRVEVPPDLNMPQARSYVDDLLSTVVQERGIRQFLLTNLVHTGTGYSWRVNIDSIAKNFNPHISTFQIPTRTVFEGETAFIAGSLSDYVRPEDEDAILDLFPAATFHYLDGAGHWLHADKPQEFLNLLVPLIEG